MQAFNFNRKKYMNGNQLHHATDAFFTLILEGQYLILRIIRGKGKNLLALYVNVCYTSIKYFAKNIKIMAATIKDIAKKANVSYGTVSRALNNKYGVRKETRERVLSVAVKMGYLPNAIARGLVKKATNSIGLIIPDILNPFYPGVARGIEDKALKNGYSVFFCNTNHDKKREIQSLRLLAEKRVDGIIVAPGLDDPDIPHDAAGGDIPIVYICRRYLEPNKSFVVIDDERGGFLGTKHLIEQGYKKIGFIGVQNEALHLNERFEGYKQAFQKYGLELDDRYICSSDFKRQTGYRLIQKMIAKGDFPRAIFAENDILALGVIQGIRESGLSTPEDIAVVGFDDIPLASFPEVQMTTIRQPKHEMGEIAVSILLDQLSGSNTQSRKVILEPRLIVRKSS
jgi:LacI family transcriptional regulator